MEIADKVLNLKTLSEFDSAELLKKYNIPVTKSYFINSLDEIKKVTDSIGFPIVMKGCSDTIAHKSDKGLVHIDIRTIEEASRAFNEIKSCGEDLEIGVIIQEMVKGHREFVIGMVRDPQFGPCVMFGLGGIFTEVFDDVVFRAAPLSIKEAKDQIFSIRSKKILGNIRGMEEVDIDTLSKILVSVGKMGLENENIKEIDINPLKIKNSQPIAVDALVVIESEGNQS